MKKYYIYKMARTGEIRTYLAKTEEDIKRCDAIFEDGNSDCIKIFDFDDTPAFFYGRIADCMNKIMEELGSIIRFEIDPISSERRVCLNMVIRDNFIDSSIINKTDSFYNTIESIFDTFELEYSYNNTRSCVFVRVKES